MLEIFTCTNCGKIAMITHDGPGQISCCGQPMARAEENVVDASTEKHVPVVEQGGDGIVVNVGSVPHPMDPGHYIEWVEVISGPDLLVRGLKPGDEARVTFPVSPTDAKVRAYCNLHGLWTNRPHRA